MVDYNKLLTNFLSESEGILEESEDTILQLEKDSSPEVIDKIFRAVHTIKGNSGLFDLPKIRELSHAMENSLNHFRNHPPDTIPETTIDLFLSTIDRLKKMISNVQESNSVDISDLVSAFASFHSLTQSSGETQALVPGRTEIPKPAPEEAPRIEKNSFPKNLKIGISKKFLQSAEEGNEYLFLGILRLDQIPGVQTLSELAEFFKEKSKQGIVKVSTVPELLPEWERAGQNQWKIFFLGKSTLSPQEALASWNLAPDSIRILRKPIAETATIEEIDLNPQTKLFSEAESERLELKNSISQTKTPVPATQVDSTRETNLKVSLRLIDDLINLAGEAVIARNELLQKIDETEDTNLHTSAKKIGTLFSKLQEGIMQTRLQELDSVFQKVPRIVRDISRTTGKIAELVQIGGEVELDKTLIDAISDPIMHMIRNSMDHGIELPAVRVQKGKPEEGTIRLSASLRGGNVIIAIEDDGKGLDRTLIAQKILEKGIMSKDQLEEASDEQVFNTVFLPGFSTSEKVTTVSGRGVGMDVVRTNLKKVGGTAEIANRPEGGTIVTLTIPQTLSIVTTLLIRTAGRRYAIPEQNVKELILVNPDNLSRVETHLIYNLRDHLLPVLDLADFLNLSRSEEYHPQYMAVLKSEKHSFGILIDEIINPEEIVVKSLGALFTGLNIFSGATIMGDGETVLILDVPGMAKFWSMQSNLDERELQYRQRTGQESQETIREIKGYLLFTVGRQQFAVSVASVPRIEKIQPSEITRFSGFEVILYRETSVPLVRLEQVFDIDTGDRERETYGIFFRLHGKYTGLLADSVEKVINELPILKTDTYVGDGILGYAVLEGVHTLFLDIEALSNTLHTEKFHDMEMVVVEEGAV
jgi:two-component system, chemotaxis family, sensor kinase CheA